MTIKRGLILNPTDNVVNVVEEVLPGDTVQINLNNEIITIDAKERIPFGFKVATRDINHGTPITKYGQQIGLAIMDIKKGTLVHVHNMAGARGRGDVKRNIYKD